ncbi:MAG: hypothetical protein BRD50_04950 [Bacteroidetes bacterium SW_11_45_7]|nr:MAG: hypothetical protein BRD50_04950 [Bacteroidetes bacterium SW_11_45_7]
MENLQKILSDLKNYLLNNYGDSIQDVILFGSQAKGQAVDYSDYDVLIVLEGDYTSRDENQILDLCYDIDLKYDILLDVHLLSTKELDSIRGRQPIYQDAIQSGIYA